MNSSFTSLSELRLFVSGMFSTRTTSLLIKKINHLAKEFDALNAEDQDIELDLRAGTSLVVAMRSGEPSVFSKLRRGG